MKEGHLTSEGIKREMIRQMTLKCRYHNGSLNHEACEAGVNYKALLALGPLPCLTREVLGVVRTPAPCDKLSRWTEAEATGKVDKMMEQAAKAIVGKAVCAADAKARGLSKGHGGAGTVACPICEKGTIHYTVASIDGHIWARCSTDDCVKFME